ncbi:MAG: VWA domain-containing protein [Bacteroidetes bacterium]|nr:VWA domain-containing protein [Bacteroidota bacterium]
MKRLLLFSVMCFISLSLVAQNKNKFDLANTLKGPNDQLSMSNPVSNITLIKGGYFTIGTTQGNSSLNLDDYNQITFGHPYALTSHPIIFADSAWVKPESLFNNFTQNLISSQDSLTAFFTDSVKFESKFIIVQQNSGNTIKFIFKLKNIDIGTHQLGLGFKFDPSIGNNGDGYPYIGGNFIQKDSIINSAVPSTFELWERDSYPKGIGTEFSFTSGSPSELIFANWSELQSGNINSNTNLKLLYDLCLQAKWNTQTINSGQEIEYSFILNFLSPEFTSNPFLRWDLTSFLSIENNALYPLEQTTTAEVFNPLPATISGCALSSPDSGMTNDWTSPSTFNINGNSSKMVTVPIEISEWYSDTIFDVYLKLKQSGVETDFLKRRIFVPAGPISNIGLNVSIDSVSVFNYPEVQVFFDAANSNTGQVISNLKKVNVFPEEDNVNIQNFTLQKDTAGGVNQADIAIILDVTGSMSNEIADVRDNIVEFADSLVQNGIDVRLGMVTFRDVVEDVFPFTSNVFDFQQFVALQNANGGDDADENSLEALHSGCQMGFRPEANRIFIWITDAGYHIAPSPWTNLTVNDVVSELISNSVKVYAIAPTNYQTQYFDQIVLNTGGDFYDINGNFRDVLLQISHLPGSNRYILKYNSAAQLSQLHTIKVELHYKGLGGYDIKTINFQKTHSQISCFPNPASDQVQLKIENSEKKECSLEIVDQLGRIIKTAELGNSSIISWNWKASDIGKQKINNGIYFLHVKYKDKEEIRTSEVVKIIFSN